MATDLPNLLTLSRIAAIPVLAALMLARVPGADLAACLLFTAAAVTDWLDGKLARARNATSDLGRMLDPIADKLLVGATLMLLAGLSRLSDVGLLAAIVIMLREIMVSGLREYLAGLSAGLPVTALAKWKTGVQMTALGMLVAGDTSAALLGIGVLPVSLIGEALLMLAAALTLITGWDYLATGLRHVKRDAAPGRERAREGAAE
ncbi:CDP-diacylglycerol--glycerol-3-phosphate 3-phosphatidyltransferase [Elioraea sp.]|uniref:CDP-diacylglycerol--glycerol-3-phosphate 3-phosphatidyltransferase n=1 Tax=Elioraea sp. TaxID=2185103 RepID=UPI0025C06C78|nr:CDP-diacylglycerol--glycerol-3-phosphate 3-phosphatidyltransferase [Elioraea sp.]